MAVISNDSIEGKQLNGLKDLAEFLGISKPSALKLKNSGRIPYIQVGNKLIFNSSDVLAGIKHEAKKLTKTKCLSLKSSGTLTIYKMRNPVVGRVSLIYSNRTYICNQLIKARLKSIFNNEFSTIC